MNCLHKNLLISSQIHHHRTPVALETAIAKLYARPKPLVNCGWIEPRQVLKCNELRPIRGWNYRPHFRVSLAGAIREDATMYPIDPIYTANMNDQQRAWFYAEYERARKDEVIGVLFALLLGCFGIHHFYLRRDGLGLLYLLFFWTGITAILGFIECFFMPGRVRQYNATQAYYISSQILAAGAYPSGSPSTHCNACGQPIDPTAVFCNHCGAAVTRSTLNTQPAH